MGKRHNKTGTKLHYVWRAMFQRCNNPKNKDFKYYGERGVRVCREWEDFCNFDSWAVLSGYREGLVIDRINNNGDYEPRNCHWVTVRENNLNKRNNRLINGIPLSKWCEESGISVGTMKGRLRRLGWSIEKASKTPVIKCGIFQGKSVIQWCKELNISYETVRKRIARYKWPLEKALFTPIKKKSADSATETKRYNHPPDASVPSAARKRNRKAA